MKKFVFELEDVLKFRKFEMQQAEIEFGKALQAEKEIQDKLNLLALQKKQTQKMMKGSSDFNAISSSSSYYDFIKKQTEFLLQKMAEAKLVTEEKRKKLQECMQKTDSLEELKKTQQAEYNRFVLSEEDKEIDDIATSRAALKKEDDF